MKEFNEVFGELTIGQVSMYITAVYVAFKLINGLINKITTTHDKFQEKENLFKLIKENSEDIKKLKKSIQDIKDIYTDYMQRSLADKLFVCYNSAKTQGYITRRQLVNYKKNEDFYFKIGGNGIVKEKYHPEIMEMSVVEDDEIVKWYNKEQKQQKQKEVINSEKNSN